MVNVEVDCLSNKLKKSINELIFLIAGLAGLFIWIKTMQLGVGLVATFSILVVYVIILYLLRLQKETKLKKAGMQQIDEMTGLEFERYLSLIFRDAGYKVKKTKHIGDYGADLILTHPKRDRKIVIQAKRYKRNVGIKAVQEVTGSIKHYKADEGWVVTNSYFTEPARKLARSNKIRLVNRDDLAKLINEIKSGTK